MRSLVIISVLIALAAALTCYSGVGGATTPLLCPSNTTQCVKQVSKYKGNTLLLEACDSPAACRNYGISNGKCQSQKANGASVNTCCCGTDLCNSAGFFQPLLATSVLFMARFI